MISIRFQGCFCYDYVKKELLLISNSFQKELSFLKLYQSGKKPDRYCTLYAFSFKFQISMIAITKHFISKTFTNISIYRPITLILMVTLLEKESANYKKSEFECGKLCYYMNKFMFHSNIHRQRNVNLLLC